MKWPMAPTLTLLLAACAEPSDVLYTPPDVAPVEVEPGLFRVTFDPAPDYVRGFTPAGDTILFRGLRSTALGDKWEILGIPAAGGLGGIEHASIYRRALSRPVFALVSRSDDRFLLWTQPGNDSAGFDGPGACRFNRNLMVWRFVMVRLRAADGAALASLETSGLIRTPTVDTVFWEPNHIAFRMRFTFGEVEAETGSNPFGPATADDTTGFLSDGQTLWRVDLSTGGLKRDSVGQGIFPTLSPDGSLLAEATPGGVDSVVPPLVLPNIGAFPWCVQQNITFSAASWTTAVIRLSTGDTIATLDGTEPVFDPDGTRLLVRRPTGLVWVNVTTRAETAVPSSAGAFGAAVSPSGTYLAFSKSVSGNVDVYFERLK